MSIVGSREELEAHKWKRHYIFIKSSKTIDPLI